ncbi:unnamed protein product, partial [Polarella glacialis]
VLAEVDSVRETYHLSEDGGFLPSRCCLLLPTAWAALEGIAAELAALNMSGRLRSAVDALPPSFDLKCVEELSEDELHRAYVLLGQLVHSYVHGPAVPWNLLSSENSASKKGSPAAPPLPDNTNSSNNNSNNNNDNSSSNINNSNSHNSNSHSNSHSNNNHSSRNTVPPQLARPWLEVCRRLQMPAVLTAGATDLWNWRLKDAAGPWELSDMDLLTSLTGTSTERMFLSVGRATGSWQHFFVS